MKGGHTRRGGAEGRVGQSEFVNRMVDHMALFYNTNIELLPNSRKTL